MNARTEIITQFKQVAQEQDLLLAPLTDELELLNSGLIRFLSLSLSLA